MSRVFSNPGPSPRSCHAMARTYAMARFVYPSKVLMLRGSPATSLLDVLDRVLDKGIVIEAWVRVSLVGIDLITVEASIVVASIETYHHHFDAMALRTPAVRRAA